MGRRNTRYKKMERMITAALCVDTIIFVAYLVFAGTGLIAMKAVSSILCILISGAILYFLYMTRELLRKRSLWMTLGAACTLLCVLVSLVLNFPAPRFILP